MNMKMTLIAALAGLCGGLAADITLPPPAKTGGKPLMEALAGRKTSRDFAPDELTPQELSSLLWAADGINRPDGRRTAPTGLNVQDIDIYVLLPSGAYMYDAKAHALTLVNGGDHRKSAGRQAFSHAAPVNLFYVQNLDRAMKTDEFSTPRHGGIHAGAVMQNVYLFCASAGLGCVARDSIDREELAKVLKLTARQRIIIAQTVGKLKGNPAKDGAAAVDRNALRKKIVARTQVDRDLYGQDGLREIERLYAAYARSREVEDDNLKALIEKYPKANRTGCAVMYAGQRSRGADDGKWFRQAIENHSDCLYGDGAQVGAYARFYLAGLLHQKGKADEAKTLRDEILKLYPDAVTHRGQRMADILNR